LTEKNLLKFNFRILKRGYLLIFFILLTAAIFIAKLFHLQVGGIDENRNLLEGSTVKKTYVFPERGYIYDRNGVLLVSNRLSYNLMVVPNEVRPLDTLEFCKLLKIDKNSFLRRYQKAKKWSPRLPSVFLPHLSKEDFAYLQENLYKYNGFYIEKKAQRYYPIVSAANVLGYVNEVNNETAKKKPLLPPWRIDWDDRH
jgi:penicillin-binding protein 2